MFVVATPRLIQANLERYLTYLLFNTSSLDILRQPVQSLPVARHQIIVVDLAAEISSHSYKLEVAFQSIINAHLSALPISVMPTSIPPSFHFDYLYLPLLDLQLLSEIALKDYVDLFKKIDALANSTQDFHL